MRYSKQPTRLLTVLLLLYAGGALMANATRLRQDPDQPQDVSLLAHVIEDVAQGLGYRSMRGSQTPDQWADRERRKGLVDHRYMTLFGKESDNSCLDMKGRIGVTILLFKDEETARWRLTQTKDDHLGNIGVKVIKSDDRGYLLEEVNGSYVGIITGSQVVLFVDRSREQGPIIKAIAESVLPDNR